TRTPNRDFVANLTLAEIRARLAAGELQETFYATESNNSSFTRFQRRGESANWRTLAELLAEVPARAELAPKGPTGPSALRLSDNFTGGGTSVAILGFGLLLAGLACVAVPIVVILQLKTLRSEASLYVLLGGIVSFCWSAALFVVF